MQPQRPYRSRVRRPLGRRTVLAALGLAGLAGALGATIAVPPRPRLIWNVSASAPVGLYALEGQDQLSRGDMVIAWVPLRWRKLAAVRGYIPLNVPLVKRVAAITGDRVCEAGGRIFINGRLAASRRAHDQRGRPMPAWSGCVTLGQDTLFLLMEAPDSFDGRYFGVTRTADVVGRARLIWAR